MIEIHLCRLENDQWVRVERHHVGFGFESMSHAVEFAEARNRQRWPGFDWLRQPTEAYLAIRD
jgi:hypothetical protein